MANNTGKKYGGRKKGTPNKDVKKIRQKIDLLLSDEWEQIKYDFKELTPKERIDVYTKLLEYSLPKMNRTDINIENQNDSMFKPIEISFEE